MMRRIDWPLLGCAFGVLMCVAFAIANAVLYANHPHGRGLNLFAMVWCSLMGASTLHSTVRVWTLRSYR